MNLRMLAPSATLALVQAVTVHAQPPLAGIFTLLLDKPFVAEVTSVSVAPGSYELSLKADGGDVRTFKREGTSPMEWEAVARLRQGRRYAFPQHLIDVLGLDNTIAVVRSAPAIPAPFLPFQSASRGLFDLARQPSFRATVLDQQVDEKNYSIILQSADTGLRHLSGPCGTETIARIARHLKRGETFEFPAILDDALIPASEREAKSRPQSAEARVLARYIGQWHGIIEEDRNTTILMNCLWKADGTGIWREITADPGTGVEPPDIDIALIIYDRDKKRYLAANPAASGPAPLEIQWNESERNFTTELPLPGSERTRVNVATFTTDDRIEWTTTTRDSAGKALSTNRGSYRRVSKTVPPRKLPPIGKQNPLAFTPPPGSSSSSIQSFSGPPQATTVAGRPPVDTDFFRLRDQPPFRGRVSKVLIENSKIAVDIDAGDFIRHHIIHARDSNWDKALAIARRFTEGTRFEFPDVLLDEYKPVPPGFIPRPTTEAMRALEPFIGEWVMHQTTQSDPKAQPAGRVIVRYLWKADGTGLWRESETPARDVEIGGHKQRTPARFRTDLITHDPAAQRYVESTYLPNGKCEATWNPVTRYYSWEAIADLREPNTRFSGTRRFVSDDRIEWQNKFTKADGTPARESAGYYERMKP